MSVWVTLTEAQNITNESNFVQADVNVAEEVIMLHAERTTEDTIRSTDLFWLKRAVAWQATWMPEQPGYKERSNAKEVIQDGTQVVWSHGQDALNPALYMLAPLALRALKNCSWMKGRSIRWRPARPPQQAGLAAIGWPTTPFPSDYTSNDDHPWEPM